MDQENTIGYLSLTAEFIICIFFSRMTISKWSLILNNVGITINLSFDDLKRNFMMFFMFEIHGKDSPYPIFYILVEYNKQS